MLCDVDARYDGQSYQLRVPLDAADSHGIDEARARFERMHEERFGFAVRGPVELVTIHLRALGPAPAPLPLSAAAPWEAEGPMSRVDEDCTLWVPPQWSVRASDGVARLTREGLAERDPETSTLELWRHRLTAIAEEMGERLTRSAFSPNIKERRDHSCALFDARGDMIALAAHIPVHLGAAPSA